MPLFEYVLLALIGSSGVAGGTPATVGPESIVQPNGGARIAAQTYVKKEDIRRSKYRRIHKHRRVRHGGKKFDGKDKKGSK